jgi:hypothetical protein
LVIKCATACGTSLKESVSVNIVFYFSAVWSSFVPIKRKPRLYFGKLNNRISASSITAKIVAQIRNKEMLRGGCTGGCEFYIVVLFY